MTTSTTTVSTFIKSQNSVLSSAGLGLDYDVALGVVPVGGNSVMEISSITTAGASAALSGNGAVIIDGGHSISPSSSGADNFAVSVAANGTVTLLDENTGKSETLSGVSYLVFNGGATTGGAFQSIMYVGGANPAEIVRMYEASLGRQPDLPGLAYYENQVSHGMNFSQIATEFMAAPEFTTKYPAAAGAGDSGGPSDSAFVTQLYQNVLGRAPASTELSYYVAALQNAEAGSIVNQVNPIAWSRATELVNFTASPEFQKINAGVVVDTSTGAYSDSGFALPGSVAASTALNVSSGGTINTASIDMTTVGSYTSVNGVALAPTVSGLLGTYSGGDMDITTSGLTVYMSAQVTSANFYNGSNETIYSAPTGGGLFVYSDFLQMSSSQQTLTNGTGNKVYLSGTGNALLTLNTPNGTAHAAPTVLTVYGAVPGDSVEFWNNHGKAPTSSGIQVDIIETPAAGSTINGTQFLSPTFGTTTPTPAGYYFPNTTVAINVGAVSDNSPTAMAAAAAKVYTPTTTGTGVPSGQQESIVFFGQGANNDTVVYKWFADTTHQVSPTTMAAGIDLIGVTPTQFEAMLKF